MHQRQSNDSFALPPLAGGKLVMGTVMLSLAVFMNVLDSSIANVSLPTIAGDLGVSPQQGTWVITSFAVANAILIPLTGWLTRRVGQVKLMLASIILFVIASWTCGMAPTIEVLIFSRILQGAVAGPMIPLSQSLLLSSYPPEKSNMALAFWGMTIMVAPIMGPVLGGWISDNYSWPWIFYINVFVGAIAAWGFWSVYHNRETPTKKEPVDLIGLALLMIWVGCLQVMLDKGKELGWFGSSTIIALAIVTAVAFIYFLVWEFGEEHPIVDLSLFKSINFSLGTVSISVAYGLFFGTLVILPLWMQTTLGYTAELAGFVMAPVGLFSILLTPLVGKAMGHIDARWLTTYSFLAFAGIFFMRAQFTVDVDMKSLLIPTILQGIPMSMFFVPLTAIILSGFPPDKIPNAAALSNFARTMCGGMGTSIITTLWEDRSTLHHAHLVEHTGYFSQSFAETTHRLTAMGLPDQAADAIVNQLITVESLTWSATDLFWGTAVLCLALIALVWTTRPVKPLGGGGMASGAH